MARVHEVLRWANRREVAREVTRRGYRLSGEALNKWVRDEKEFPAVVERIVFELFTITGHKEAAPPEWAERLARESEGRIIAAIENADLLAVARQVREDLEALRQQPAEASDDRTDAPGRGSSGQLGRVRE